MVTREKIIQRYLEAYNQFDVEGMLKDVAENIIFENISNGVTTLKTEGIEALRKQAVQATHFFSERQQNIVSIVHEADKSIVEIDYSAVLAMDFPNGLQKGQKLNLKGKSIFQFLGNKIVAITDIS